MARNTQSSTSGNKGNTGMSGGSDYEHVADACHTAFLDGQKVISHCLGQGEMTAEPHHLKLLIDGCVAIQACAQLCASGSEFCEVVCASTAEVAKACEEACEEYEDEDVFASAVESFRACYEACNEAAGGDEIEGWDEEGQQLGESPRGSSSSGGASRNNRSERTSSGSSGPSGGGRKSRSRAIET
jgi:hypothetical protein